MNINRDIGKVLLQLESPYYERGIRKISVSLNGIRNEKIPYMSRKVIIPQIIKSKKCEKFVEQFIENLKDDFMALIEEENIKVLIENPSELEKIKILSKGDRQLLYLYLVSLREEKYNDILQVLLQEIESDSSKMTENKSNIAVKEKEIEKYQSKCKKYEEEIEKITFIAKQRKEKINDLELKLNIIYDENEKNKKEKIKLLSEIQDLKAQIQKYNETQCIQENIKLNEEICDFEKKKSCIVMTISSDKLLIKSQEVIQVTQNDFFSIPKDEIEDFEWICVYKKGIHISKLRKIKQLSKGKAIFFESLQEIQEFVYNMEGNNENRSN